MTKNVLMIMNPRAIPEVLEAFEALPIDKMWMRAFSEYQLACGVIKHLIESTQYENYIICSDDVIVTSEALAAVEELLERVEIASGWAWLNAGSDIASITIDDVGLTGVTPRGMVPVLADYPLINSKQLDELPDEFEATCAGYALTGARRDIWLKYPYEVYVGNSADGHSSDHHWSYRIQNEHKIWVTKAGYIDNLKPDPTLPMYDYWIRDREKPSVRCVGWVG